MEDTSDAKGSKRDVYGKRDIVVRIPKPKDEKKQVFKKMLLLNMGTDNCLGRSPVFAWENEYRDIEQDRQVGSFEGMTNVNVLFRHECSE